VIQFPALSTTGMHGTEHCIKERRTIRLSAPQPLSFLNCWINASKLAAAFYLALLDGAGRS
jgi:hypothetical protein